MVWHGYSETKLARATQPLLEASLRKGDWRKPKMMKKRVVPANKLRHLARSVSTVAESNVSVEETERRPPQCWKD